MTIHRNFPSEEIYATSALHNTHFNIWVFQITFHLTVEEKNGANLFLLNLNQEGWLVVNGSLIIRKNNYRKISVLINSTPDKL